ncbi:superoxide dismutase family protein [Lentzea sp. NBRC 102530]|uniref:superoxide dismutase family protein n=1 Tax=Lentzea sp. NBRC 102530 TaxID=3032201 RepID=UPI0024A4DF43|nr:superoxide dismutase family protein [Lentzea sp. NBRC 102530]GLY54155.1 hypothetical protein Lesp01_78110 [Lentzea sp. NBRC 102530]
MRTSVATLAGAVLLIGGLAACSSSPTAPPAAPPAPAIKPIAETSVAAPAATGNQPAGVTYDVARIPVGAKLSTGSSVTSGRTAVELTVSGLLPNTKYGAHVHTKPCGAKGADAGPHYQNQKDPVSPSVDPEYANAENEIWLDFTTDASGAATGKASVQWEFRKGEANSVIVHATHSSTEHGKAGTAGDRLACLTAAF